ncbi:MAG: hypothetical protein R2857_07425 [Vampirovibrionales bacterium]
MLSLWPGSIRPIGVNHYWRDGQWLGSQDGCRACFIAAVPIMVLATAYVFAKHLGDMVRPTCRYWAWGLLFHSLVPCWQSRRLLDFCNVTPCGGFEVYRIVVAVLCFWLFL